MATTVKSTTQRGMGRMEIIPTNIDFEDEKDEEIEELLAVEHALQHLLNNMAQYGSINTVNFMIDNENVLNWMSNQHFTDEPYIYYKILQRCSPEVPDVSGFLCISTYLDIFAR